MKAKMMAGGGMMKKSYAAGGKIKKGGMAESKMMKKEGRGMAKADMQKHSDVKKNKPMMEKVAKKAVKGHESRMHDAKKMMGGGMARMPSRGEHSIQKQSTRGAEDVTMMKKGGGVKKMRMGGKC